MSFGRSGALGRGFGHLGSGVKAGIVVPPPPNTLVAGVGTFILTGDSMTPLVDYKLPAAQGTFLESASVAALGVGYVLPAATGAFVETGFTTTGTKSGGATTTWNPSDKSVNVTLTPTANLTVTQSSSSGNPGVRSIASHLTGLYYAEFHIDAQTSSVRIGIANATANIDFPNGEFDNDSLGYITSNGEIKLNGVGGTFVSAAVVGDTVSMIVDMGNKSIWFRTNSGNWNNNASANPATNTLGYSFAGMNAGPYFVKFCGGGNLGDAVTANFGGSTYAQSVTAGVNW